MLWIDILLDFVGSNDEPFHITVEPTSSAFGDCAKCLLRANHRTRGKATPYRAFEDGGFGETSSGTDVEQVVVRKELRSTDEQLVWKRFEATLAVIGRILVVNVLD